jgi:hypothetical protein
MGRGTQGWFLVLLTVAYFGAVGGVIGLLISCHLSKVKLAGALLLVLTAHAAMWTAGAQRLSRALASIGPLPAKAMPDGMFKASPTPGRQ